MFLIAHILFIIYMPEIYSQNICTKDHWFGGKMKRNEMKNKTKPIYLNIFDQLI